MADKEINLTLKVDAEEAIKATEESKRSMTKLEKAQKSYTDTLSESGQEIRSTNKAKQQLAKQQDLEAQAANSAKGSYEQLSAQYRLNVLQLNAMGEAERKTSEHGKKLTAETLKIRQSMSEAKQETGDNTLEVGSYRDSIKDAAQQSGLFGKLLDLQSKAQAAYSTVMKASSVATDKGVGSVKKFGLALTATGIGLFIAVLAVLINSFVSMQEGMDTVTAALAPLIGAFEVFKGILQEIAMNTFKKLKEQFTIAVNSIALGIAKIRQGWAYLSGDTETYNEQLKLAAKYTNDIATANNKLIELNKKRGDIQTGILGKLKKGAETQTEIHRLGIEIEKLEIGLAKRKAKVNVQFRIQQDISRDTAKSGKERLVASEKAMKLAEKSAKFDMEVQDLKVKKKQLENTLNDTSRADAKEQSDLEAERIKMEADLINNNIRFNARASLLRKQIAEKEDKRNAELTKRRTDRLIAADKAVSDAKLSDESADDDADVEAEMDAEFANIVRFNDAKKKLEDDLRLADAEDEQAREELKLELATEKQLSELDQMVLDDEQKSELEALLLEQKEDKLQGIREKWGKKKLSDQKALDAKELESKRTSQQAIRDALVVGVGALANIFKKNKALQVAAIVAEKANAIASIGISAARSMVTNHAKAVAIGPPQNIPAIALATTQNVGTGIMAGAQIATIAATTKFKNGGYLNGPTHAGGGINLGFGQEAEGGEFIASRATMSNPQLRGIVEQANAAGNAGQSMNTGISREEAIELAREVVSSTPVYVIESEITDAQRIVQVRESEFNG